MSLAPVDSGQGGLLAEREREGEGEREKDERAHKSSRSAHRREIRFEIEDPRTGEDNHDHEHDDWDDDLPTGGHGDHEKSLAASASASAGEAGYHIASRSSNDRNPSNDAARHLSLRRTSCVHQILQLLPAFLRTYYFALLPLSLSLLLLTEELIIRLPFFLPLRFLGLPSIRDPVAITLYLLDWK